MEPKNRTAIITGARRGIGKDIAIALAKEGYDVVVSDIVQEECDKVAEEITRIGVRAIGIKCDVSKKKEVKSLFEKTIKKLGRVDILVNNAGIFPFTPFSEMEEADWDKVMDVNLKGVFYSSKEAAKVLPVGGRIINISSIAAFVGFEGLVHYCASKGAINGMVRALALELAPKKITVNAVAPGAIDTPGASPDKKAKEQLSKTVPLGRIGKGEDIANAVVYLASEGASYVTGQVIIVDGGYTLR
ncbi:MAG: SDR family NAD(P)-dependent oxidoreductase [Candidatus Pacebacteria bacterium]|nr:SDR family NAD(P)-dependent oxidoreductase [Candidatus Paceibacterota bacterium]